MSDAAFKEVQAASAVETDWSPDLDPDDLRDLMAAEHDPVKILQRMPRESSRMEYYATVCMVFNRMIGKLSRWFIPNRVGRHYDSSDR